MDVRRKFDWPRALAPYVTLVVLGTFSSVHGACVEPRETSDDRFAEQDIRDAGQDIDRMQRILGAELQRLESGADGSESEEVAPYLHESSGKPMDLGDVRIALSERYTEMERRQMVAAISLYKTEMSQVCDDVSPSGIELSDAGVRARALAALHCHQHQADRILSGMHKILQGYVVSMGQLKLPRFTQEKMSAQARIYALTQYDNLAYSFEQPRQVWQAGVDLLRYLDKHAAHAHYSKNQISFDDPVEAKTSQDLLNRLKAVMQ